jgi:hypothetical protein
MEKNEEHYVNELNSQQNVSILNREKSFGFLCSGSTVVSLKSINQ